MNRTPDWGRPAIRSCSLALLGLIFALPGCGGSNSNAIIAGKDPHEAERRKEMRKYMETNPQKGGKAVAKPPRNHP
jgi:hypothetical protein